MVLALAFILAHWALLAFDYDYILRHLAYDVFRRRVVAFKHINGHLTAALVCPSVATGTQALLTLFLLIWPGLGLLHFIIVCVCLAVGEGLVEANLGTNAILHSVPLTTLTCRLPASALTFSHIFTTHLYALFLHLDEGLARVFVTASGVVFVLGLVLTGAPHGPYGLLLPAN